MKDQVLSAILILFGEGLSVAAELVASRRASAIHADYASIFVLALLPVVLGSALLVIGYMFGYLHLKNIWIISALSIASILIVEPLLTLILFRQLPTVGAAIGLVFGVLGTLAAIFV